MKETFAKIFIIIFAAAVFTAFSFALYELFTIAVDSISAAFIVIEFTIITGVITTCYLMRKWTKKDSDGNDNEEV